MKTIKRELAHVGMFGPDGTTVTREHLADCKETFDGKCPLTLGHRLADWMPKFGNVQSVELDKQGDSLVGVVEEQDLLADAREAGFYTDLSVGIQKRAVDGKHYLHHVAYLGAVPPKIRDLRIFADIGVVYCGDGTGTTFTTKPEDLASAAAKLSDAKQRAGWSLDDVRSNLNRLFAWATEMAVSGAIPSDLQAQAMQMANQFTSTPKEDDVESKEQIERLTKELADSNAARLATAKDGLKKAMEGRVPKAKQNLVLALADTLGAAESIELSDDEGKKESVTGLEILRRILEVIPLPVKPGTVDLGDGADTAKPVDMSKLMSRV